MIIKGNPLEYQDKSLLHPLIRNKKGLIILDYRFRVHERDIIPIKFINKIIFVNKKSFIQNNIILGNKIRKYVLKNINENKKLICIGGESYNYLFFVNSGIFYTNSNVILEDFYYNKKIYNKNLNGEIIDYNKINKSFDSETIILNLSKLNINLLQKINNSNLKYIIIINCHHKDFWKKIIYLNKFKLISRKKFIDEKIGYYITVNIFLKL